MNAEIIYDHIYETSEGHEITWRVSVNNLRLLHAQPFDMTHRTFCVTSPTQWNIRISIPDVKEDGSCSVSAWLERVDSLHHLGLEACIWVDICDANEDLIFFRHNFTKIGMLPGEVIDETAEMRPKPNMRHAVFRNAIVFITFLICFCHSESDISESDESD